MRQLFATSAFILASCSADAPTDSDASTAPIVDASIDASPAIEFEPPIVQATINSSGDERFGALSSGGNAIFFARSEVMNGFIVNVPYVARRMSLDLDWGMPLRAAAFGTVSIWDFEMADDELEWFHWKGLGQLSVSVRDSINDGWSAPAELGFDGFSPSLTRDHLTLYYVTLEGQVMRRRRAARGVSWQPAEPVSIDGDLDIASIDISRDELSLLITARSDDPLRGIYLATRATPDEPFSRPIAIPNLVGAYENARFGLGDLWISLVDRHGPDRDLAISRRSSN